MSDAFFLPADGAYRPTDRARGPWTEDSLHGRMISGLVAHVVETRHADPDFNFTRLTLDLIRPTRFDDVTVATSLFRDGNRIRVVDASVVIRGEEIAQARVMMLRRGDPPEGEIWTPEAEALPDPERLPQQQVGSAAPANTAWDMRPVRGQFGVIGRRTIWQRALVPLVLGEPTGPFAHVSTAADNTNPWSNSGDRGLVYVNADLTLYLHRPPEGEWICVDVTTHQATEGIAVGGATLHDLRGPVGQAVVGALANRVRR